MKAKFGHICMLTKDLAKTERFYIQILGMEKVFTFYRDGKRIGLYLRIDGTHFIEIFETPDAHHAPSTLMHLCLQVESVDKAREELLSHGIEVTEKVLGGDNSYQAWFKDPNGLDIELHEYTEASTQLTGADIYLDS